MISLAAVRFRTHGVFVCFLGPRVRNWEMPEQPRQDCTSLYNMNSLTRRTGENIVGLDVCEELFNTMQAANQAPAVLLNQSTPLYISLYTTDNAGTTDVLQTRSQFWFPPFRAITIETSNRQSQTRRFLRRLKLDVPEDDRAALLDALVPPPTTSAGDGDDGRASGEKGVSFESDGGRKKRAKRDDGGADDLVSYRDFLELVLAEKVQKSVVWLAPLLRSRLKKMLVC